MTTFFFPSCKAKADYPAASEQLREYVRGRIPAPILHKLYRWEARRGTAKGPPPDFPRFSTQMG